LSVLSPSTHPTHDDQNQDKLRHLFALLPGLGYSVKGKANEIHPQALQKVLDEVHGEAEEMIVSKLMLRSMKQAKYDPKSIGHFGLATQFSTHFTSPIRRYPDLTVHRLIRNYLINKKMDQKTVDKWKEELP